MGRERTYYIYIMASKGRVLYVGVTGFLMHACCGIGRERVGSSRGGIRCSGWFTLRRFGMWGTRLHARR